VLETVPPPPEANALAEVVIAMIISSKQLRLRLIVWHLRDSIDNELL